MHTHTINGVTLRARTPEALFKKVARALGGRSYLLRLDCWTVYGEYTYEITATTYLPRQRHSEINGRRLVTVRGWATSVPLGRRRA
jgi:hypothetical protein